MGIPIVSNISDPSEGVASKGRVLIVDDDPALGLLLDRMLSRAGFTCSSITDGGAALEILSTIEHDVVFVDMIMPGMDGLSVLTGIRERGLETVPIMISGYSETERAVAAMKLGAFDYIRKPMGHSEVVGAAERALQHRCAVRFGRTMAGLASQWQSIFDAAPDMMLIVDREFRIVCYNRALAERHGVGRDAFVGLHCHEALCQDDHPRASCPLLEVEASDNGRPVEFEQGQWHGHFEASVVPLRYDPDEEWGWLHVIRDVTVARMAAERLSQSESLLRSIIEASNDAILVFDREGRITEFNPAAECIFGRSSLDVFHRDVSTLFAESASPAALQEGSPFGSPDQLGRAFPLTAARPDGQEAPVEVSLSSGEANGEQFTVAVVRDITDRRRAEETLRRNEAFVTSIVETAPAVIVGLDGGLRITLWNGYAEQLTGRARRDVIGKSWLELFVPLEERDVARESFQSVLTRQASQVSLQNTLVCADGAERAMLWENSWLSSGPESRACILCIGLDITVTARAQRALLEAESKYRTLMHNLPIGVFRCTPDVILMSNPRAAEMFGLGSVDELVGMDPHSLFTCVEDCDALLLLVQRQGFLNREEMQMGRPDGRIFWALITATITGDHDSGATIIDGSIQDITENKLMETQLRHAQKLESIGQLAAGIAHEINTPTQYVGDNTRFLSDGFKDLLSVISACDAMLAAASSGPLPPEIIDEARRAREKADLDYLMEEIPRAIAESLEGVDRVSRIVRAMKDFSHPGNEEKTPVDINKAILSTLTVARNEYKYVAELETDLDEEMPLVPCLPGDFNQAILNLVINAAHAIGDAIKGTEGARGKITVSTRRDGDWAEIHISDTGGGIPEHIAGRIFDPFFTTKEVGKGTGQGLAITHSVVVDKHGGTISFITSPGSGTTFNIRLPLHRPPECGEASVPALMTQDNGGAS